MSLVRKEIRETVRDEVYKAIQAQMKQLVAIASIPFVSKREQADIVRVLKKMTPSDREIVKTIKFRI